MMILPLSSGSRTIPCRRARDRAPSGRLGRTWLSTLAVITGREADAAHGLVINSDS
jgi:hypothetical protein